MSEQQQPDPALEGAGLSASGRTADQFEPGQAGPGTTYGDPGGNDAARGVPEGAGPGQDSSRPA